MTLWSLFLTFSALLHNRVYPFLLKDILQNDECDAKIMNIVTERKTREIRVASSLNAISTFTDHCDLSGKSHFHWVGQWPQGSETPLGVILYRCQEPEVSRGKMKAIHSSNDIGLWYHKAIWAESSKVRKAHKDWWLEKYYMSKVWQAIKRNYRFYDCVAKAPQGYLY